MDTDYSLFRRQAALINQKLNQKTVLTYPEKLFKILYEYVKKEKKEKNITEIDYFSADKKADDALFATYFYDDIHENEYEKIVKETREIYNTMYYYFFLGTISRLLISYLIILCILLKYDYGFLLIPEKDFQKYNLSVKELKELLIYFDEKFNEENIYLIDNLIEHYKALIYLILYLIYIDNLHLYDEKPFLNMLKKKEILASDYPTLENLTSLKKENLLEKLNEELKIKQVEGEQLEGKTLKSRILQQKNLQQKILQQKKLKEITFFFKKKENLKNIIKLIKNLTDNSSSSLIRENFISKLIFNNGLFKISSYLDELDELDELAKLNELDELAKLNELDELAKFILYINTELETQETLSHIPEINPILSENMRVLNLFYLLAYILFLKKNGKLTDELINQLLNIRSNIISFLEAKTAIKKEDILQELQNFKIGGDKKRKKKILKRYKNKKMNVF